MRRPLQGEVWMANFSAIVGNEQEGIRPALVVSRNERNRTGLCMVVPGTRTHKNLPGRVKLPRGTAGVADDTYLLSDQLRTVSAARFLRLPGAVETKYLRQTLTQIGYFLTIP
ncbi:MAG TPA: type II toxin-antitoxin system PemK/MazF family toxin [Longimicrobium sp.]